MMNSYLSPPIRQSAWIFLTVLMIAEILLIVGIMLTFPNLRLRPVLMLTSTTFVLLAFVGGAEHSVYGRLTATALIFCWLGDFFGPVNFLWGLGSFLIAHLFLIGGYFTQGVELPRTARAALFFVPLSGGIFLWLLPHISLEEIRPVGAYVFVITLMAVAAWGITPSSLKKWLVAAAVLFYISDIFVARSRFIRSELLNHLLCYLLYYTACMLFALSIAFKEKTKPQSA